MNTEGPARSSATSHNGGPTLNDDNPDDEDPFGCIIKRLDEVERIVAGFDGSYENNGIHQ
jgi:hypothetical protein